MKMRKMRCFTLLIALVFGVFSGSLAADLESKAASSVSISIKKKTINVGEELQLSATVKPDDMAQVVRWSSSDASRAKVDSNGLVTATRKGNVTITATAENGKRAVCKLTIKQPMQELRLNKAQLGLVKGKKQKLKASIVPYDSSDKKLSWSSSNKKVATVSKGGVVTAKGRGQALITVKSKNGLKAQCTVSVAKNKKAIKDFNFELPDYATVPVSIEDLSFTTYGVKIDFLNLSRRDVERMLPGGEWEKAVIFYGRVPPGYELWRYSFNGMSFHYSCRNDREVLTHWGMTDLGYMRTGVVGTIYNGVAYTHRGITFGNTAEDCLDVYGMPNYIGWQTGGTVPDVPDYELDIFQYFITPLHGKKGSYELQLSLDRITHKLISIQMSGPDPLL